MTRLLTAVFLFASFHAFADDLIEFKDGDVIKAEDFNHNFEELEAAIANMTDMGGDLYLVTDMHSTEIVRFGMDDDKDKRLNLK